MLLPCHCSCTASTQSICIFSRADKRAVGWRSIANNNKHYYDYSVQAQAQALNADFESLKLLQLQPVLFLLPAACSLTAGRELTWIGMWYIKFHDAKWMIICDYTRQQVRYMVSANPWAEGHAHTNTAASCMEFNEGGSWRGRGKLNDDKANTNMRATAPRQSSVFTVPRFMRSILLDSWQRIHTYVFMYIRSWCSWLCVNGQRTRFYIERQIGC